RKRTASRRGRHPVGSRDASTLTRGVLATLPRAAAWPVMVHVETISVLLADDNFIVREGVRALLDRDPSVDVVGVAGDYDELISQAIALTPQVLVTDIRMPPTFQDEGI